MRWPIRNQILLPFAGLQLAAIAVLAISAAVLAVREAETETRRRLEKVVSTLGRAHYPLTRQVLSQMRELTGAEFLVLDEQGQVAGTTLPTPLASEFVTALPPVQPEAQPWQRLELARERYLAGRVQVQTPPGQRTLFVFYPERDWIAARRNAWWPPLLIGLMTLLLGIGISSWLAVRMGRRFQGIQEQVARIAAGDFTQLPSGQHDDEIRDLTGSVNRMSAGLRVMTSEIRDQERAKLITQLAGGLAHQLRNSLTGARMAVQVHARRCPMSNQESLDVALRQLELTESQIKGLLRLTRDDRRVPVAGQMRTIVDGVSLLVRPACTHARVQFSIDNQLQEEAVQDADALHAALLSLLLNALEAAGPEGRVHLSAGPEPTASGRVLIEILDDGPGISESVRSALFQPFVTTKPEGIGLGLTLAFQAAQEQGGWLSSERREDWTCFRMVLNDSGAISTKDPDPEVPSSSLAVPDPVPVQPDESAAATINPNAIIP